jgi:hypothetical protein
MSGHRWSKSDQAGVCRVWSDSSTRKRVNIVPNWNDRDNVREDGQGDMVMISGKSQEKTKINSALLKQSRNSVARIRQTLSGESADGDFQTVCEKSGSGSCEQRPTGPVVVAEQRKCENPVQGRTKTPIGGYQTYNG